MDLDVRVAAALPVLEEDAADLAVEAASEECKEWAGGGGRGWRLDLRRDVSGEEVDFRDADVFLGLESLGDVGVAEGPDGPVVEVWVS